jgi:hypothetical protein
VRYQVSGTVTDEHGSPVANAFVELWYSGANQSQAGFDLYPAKRIATHAAGAGRYDFSFESDQVQFLGNPNLVGIVRAKNDVEVLPAGTSRIDRSLRYRQIPSISSGQSVVVSIDRGSPRALDQFLADFFGTSRVIDLSRLREWFRVAVPRRGTLTIEMRALAVIPELRAHCFSGRDESCDYIQFTPLVITQHLRRGRRRLGLGGRGVDSRHCGAAAVRSVDGAALTQGPFGTLDPSATVARNPRSRQSDPPLKNVYY